MIRRNGISDGCHIGNSFKRKGERYETARLKRVLLSVKNDN